MLHRRAGREAPLNLLVMGMHRSGTSALGGALLAAGLTGGSVDDLQAPGPPNPAGYAERKDIVAFNDRLLSRLGWSWDAPPSAPPTVVEPLPDLVGEGRGIVADVATDASPWCIKDPRISVLLPWWRRILLDRFVAIVTVRSPEEVAWSLTVRDDFPFDLGLALWAAYHRHLAQGLAGLPVVVVDYEALVGQPGDVVSRVLAEIGRLGVPGSFDAEAGAEFIQPELRRATQPPATTATSALADVARLHAEWSTGDVAVHDRFQHVSPEPSPWEVALLETHRRGGLAHAEHSRLSRLLAARDDDLASSQAQVRAIGTERDDLRARLETTEIDRDGVRALLETAETERDDLRTRAEQAEIERGDLRTRLETAETERDDLRARLETAETERDDLRARLETAETERDGLRDGVSQADAAATSLRARLDAMEAERDEMGRALARTAGDRDELRSRLSELQGQARVDQERLEVAQAEREAVVSRLTRLQGTTPGRVAVGWAGFADRHPRRARALAAPTRLISAARPSRIRQRFEPNPLFDAAWYLATYADVRSSGIDAWNHYRKFGVVEGRDPNPLFDTDWYLARNPDVRQRGMDPLLHYLRVGAPDGRDPSPSFDSAWYLDQNPDVRVVGLNPLLHYLRSGQHEGRAPRPLVAHALPGSWAADLGGGAPGMRIPTAGADVRPAASPSASVAREQDDGALLERIRRIASESIPSGAWVAVVSGGHPALVDIPGLRAEHFPLVQESGLATWWVGGTLSAIATVAVARAQGVEYLLVPQPSFDWLGERSGLAAQLRAIYPLVADDPESCIAYDLRPSSSQHHRSVLRSVREAIGARRSGSTAESVVLDLSSNADLAGVDLDAKVFAAATDPSGELPYLDGSIDVVVAMESDPRMVEEATRVASTAVVVVERSGARESATIRWIGEQRDDHEHGVSIIIPTYQDVIMTERCLHSLYETLPQHVDAEVIVVDDGSEADVVAHLGRMIEAYPTATLVKNETNLGFVASINRGAQAAAREFLVLLNNDTVLLPHWLPPLLWVFDHVPNAGAVGAKLLYPDGRLQEAGGVVFQDGSAAKFGYGSADPEAPVFSFLRPVDYVSAALLATPRATFMDMGGLDPAYGFGYYDDTDYAFKLRQRGCDVYFQPESAIVHLEGGSAGTDLSVGQKRNQVRNQVLFESRWKEELERQPVRPEFFDQGAWLALATVRGVVGQPTR